METLDALRARVFAKFRAKVERAQASARSASRALENQTTHVKERVVRGVLELLDELTDEDVLELLDESTDEDE